MVGEELLQRTAVSHCSLYIIRTRNLKQRFKSRLHHFPAEPLWASSRTSLSLRCSKGVSPSTQLKVAVRLIEIMPRKSLKRCLPPRKVSSTLWLFVELPSLLPGRQETTGKHDGCDFHVQPGVLSVLVSGG